MTRFELAVDCGAHRGTITSLLAERFSRVVAVEPSELSTQIVFPNVEVIQKALGSRPGYVGMTHGPDNTGQRHVVDGNDIEMITLDSLNLAPDFIKIDVEGMEWHVLMGGEQTIQQHRPLIMFEENGLNARYGIHDGQVSALLESWGATRALVRQSSATHADLFYSWGAK